MELSTGFQNARALVAYVAWVPEQNKLKTESPINFAAPLSLQPPPLSRQLAVLHLAVALAYWLGIEIIIIIDYLLLL